MKTISLSKGIHKYIFKYEDGNESAMIQCLVDMVKNRDLQFDWFDAAIVAHNVSKTLADKIKKERNA